MKKILLIIFLCYFIDSNAQQVNTQFGQIQGTANGNVFQFLGIPFAKPPINDLRWKAPQNPDAWSTVLNTTTFAPACPQKNFSPDGTSSSTTGDEDCLYLNVWTPQVASATLPVLVFIHGGGNQQGSASTTDFGTQTYFGKNLSERGNAVVVTISYRLGPLGFLVHPGLEPETTTNTSGNYAIMDQILALRWVQNNIANFGGDSTKVMVFGQSAGGVDVGNLLNTPMAAGLFQRACIESGVPIVASYNSARNSGITFVNTFTTTGTDTDKITYMRTLPAMDIIASETPALSGGVSQGNWKSVIDGVYFNNTAFANFQGGNFNKVPLLLGSNSEEMSISAPATVTPAMVTSLINSMVPTNLQATANTLYPPGTTNTAARQSYVGILTDSQFTTNARRIAQCVSANQTEPVWRYFFTYKHTIPQLATYGSYHGMELFYIFNTWENTTLGSGSLYSANDGIMENLMLSYWVNFANTGNPNGTGLTAWPQYANPNDCYLEINQSPNGSQCGVRTVQSNFWDAVNSYTPCSSSLAVAENVESQSIKIYPNPTADYLNVFWGNTTPYTSCSYTIQNELGQILKNGTLPADGKITVSELNNGLYFIVLSDNNNNRFTDKFIKK